MKWFRNKNYPKDLLEQPKKYRNFSCQILYFTKNF